MSDRDETFRDSIATIDQSGKRKWIYAKKPSGKLYRYRTYLAVFLLLLLFIGPLIKVKGQPLLLLNFFEREFIFFGLYLWPQDTYILFLITITLIVFIILFTVVYGRLWCGWTCPQTIFLEMIFRKIEYLIEGDYQQQIRLNNQRWNIEKTVKRMSKHLIFILISLLIITTLASYVVGVQKIKTIIFAGPLQYPLAFLTLGIFSMLFYLVFSWFREQVCIIVCPYGRLQGVLLDSKSIVVSYDFLRGEKRAPLKKNQDRKIDGKGDCIDCLNCFSVCPTGIDIRNGTQLECVNCTACIDACNEVMKKINLPKGLIRLASQSDILKGRKPKINWRTIAYSFVLITLITTLITIIITRKPVEATIIRTPGLLYQVRETGEISNLYNIKLINKTRQNIRIHVEVLSHHGVIETQNSPLTVNKQSSEQTVFFLLLKNTKEIQGTIPVQFGIYADNKLIDKIKLTFVGPIMK